MKPYYQDEWVTQYCSDALSMLRELEDSSIDLLCTDPPYGIAFMGKDWDRALPDKRIWAECLRVLKPGAFAFVMSIPRSDCQSRMVISLEDAGFRTNFTPIYWAYASGFPKAQNIGKAVDKSLGVKRGRMKPPQVIDGWRESEGRKDRQNSIPDNNAITPQAKALDGSYGGFQPKPAVEVIIVCMKPLSEKTFVDQALRNQKGITWLDDCRVPYESEKDKEGARFGTQMDIRGGNLKTPVGVKATNVLSSQSGRFPANLIVSDDVLNDGRVSKSGKDAIRRQEGMFVDHHLGGVGNLQVYHPDSGSFSRYFDLDKWAQKTFPFLIVPKASKSEKNRGLDDFYWLEGERIDSRLYYRLKAENELLPSKKRHKIARGNIHSTVKPLRLMSYLITLGSRPGDTAVDPFGGSGTTAKASKLLGRHCITSETEEKYCEIAAKRCSQSVLELTI